MLVALEDYEVNVKDTRSEYTYFVFDHMKFPSSRSKRLQPPRTRNLPRISYERHVLTFNNLSLMSIQHFLPFPFALDSLF